jgi:predicted dehydrogenase
MSRRAMPLKVGVIGMGGIGVDHARVYDSDPLSELVCVCDIVEEKAEPPAERFGVKAYYDVAGMLEAEDLDLVGVCTGGHENGSLHYEPVMQCLGAGKHVLCEKPISNRIEEGREMVAEARRRGLYFGINLNHRFVPLIQRAKAFHDSEMGEDIFCRLSMWIGYTRSYQPPDSPRVEGYPYFHVRAFLPHPLDIGRHFFGDVVKVQAFLGQPGFRREAGDAMLSTVAINMLFESGAVGHLMSSRDLPGGLGTGWQRWEFAGTEGRFVLDDQNDTLTVYRHASSPDVTVVRSPLADTFQRRIHRFLEQVTAGVPRPEIEASGEEGLAVQEIIEAAIRSHETSAVVEPVAVPSP